uniref:NADH dehydrogenase subunit 4L n=1 Tax=Solenopsis invicta TaxID=13686 RepID=E3VRX9_SOLIN|nr:NADH dehydrogenase subunit 4L [Solenopsis invicta]
MFVDMLFYSQLMILVMLFVIFMYKYMLILLMLIELMVMGISLLMFLIFSMINLEFYLIYYLVFSVCEGVLGLSLLVIIVRFCGSDLYYMFNISKF